MEAFFEALTETGWGALVLGVLILIAIFLEFFQKPKT